MDQESTHILIDSYKMYQLSNTDKYIRNCLKNIRNADPESVANCTRKLTNLFAENVSNNEFYFIDNSCWVPPEEEGADEDGDEDDEDDE